MSVIFLKRILCVNLSIFIFACVPQIQQTVNPKINSQLKIKNKIEQQIQNVNPQKPACHLTEKRLKPHWIEEQPQNEHYLYGIGIAPKQISVSNQIQAAKILAMRDISQQITVYVNSKYQEIIKETGYQGTTSIESHTNITTESFLQRIKTIDQWNDVENCNIYMLVSVKLFD